MSFWDFFWLVLLGYLLITYLMLLFTVLGDLFRDEDTGGFVKALWVVFLVVTPFVALLVYLLVRGRGMARRANAAVARDRAAQETYVRELAGTTSPSQQVAQATALLDEQAISPQEFEQLKARALAG